MLYKYNLVLIILHCDLTLRRTVTNILLKQYQCQIITAHFVSRALIKDMPTMPSTVIGCLHDKANMKQTSSKLRAHIVHVYIQYICFMFTSSCKHNMR